MAIEVFNRYEHKYLLDRKSFPRAQEIMSFHMKSDPYNINGKPYTIANIYYDTPDDYLIRNSLEKPAYKEKLRLRAYGVPGMDTKVFLEIKKKYNGIVNKRRSVLKLSEAYRFTETGILPRYQDYMNPQVLSELSYFLKFYQPVPKLYLAYDRIAYFEEGNPDLRISFDQNIRSRRFGVALELGDYGEPLFDQNTYLMEIKTSLAKPLWLCKMLEELNLSRVSISKYGTEYARYVSENQSRMVV